MGGEREEEGGNRQNCPDEEPTGTGQQRGKPQERPAEFDDRQRWLRTLRFQGVDHVPDEEFGYWSDTLVRWQAEGLPAAVRNDPQADRYFGFARRARLPVHVGVWPPGERRVLEEDERHRVVVDGLGVTLLDVT